MGKIQTILKIGVEPFAFVRDWLKANLWIPQSYEGFSSFQVSEQDIIGNVDFESIAHLPISARRDIVERSFGFGPFPANNMSISYSQCQHCNERLRHYIPICWACGSLMPVDSRGNFFAFYLTAAFALMLSFSVITGIFTDYYELAIKGYFILD